jgi:hypothetical protein
VITYLTQLLDTGFFHADPHPGNMLRSPDGRLVILDFGLMTQITEIQKYGMIEAIAHLIHRLARLLMFPAGYLFQLVISGNRSCCSRVTPDDADFPIRITLPQGLRGDRAGFPELGLYPRRGGHRADHPRAQPSL